MFLFSRHYAIERFGVVFIILSLLMSSLTISIVWRKKQADKELASNKVLYSYSMTMSKTGAHAEIIKFMVDKTRTHGFLLFKFDEEAMDLISIDAKDYKIFISSAKNDFKYDKPGNNQPAGRLFVFGQTGYMGLYLVNSQPWDSHMMNIVIRNTKDYSGQEVDDSKVTDKTFAWYDQGSIYLNPGGKNAEHVAFLDKKLNLMDMYKQSVIYDREAEIKDVLKNDLVEMDKLYRNAGWYMDRLTSGQDGAALANPGFPELIVNDKIIVKSDGKELTWDDEANGWLDDTGQVYNRDSLVYYYEPTTVFPGGYSFNWQDVSIDTGWIDDLRGNVSIESYLNSQAERRKTEHISDDLTRNWTYTDGTEFIPVLTGSTGNAIDPTTEHLSKDIERLNKAWSDYVSLKRQYEEEDLLSLLYLEREVNNVVNSFTINESKDLVTLW